MIAFRRERFRREDERYKAFVREQPCFGCEQSPGNELNPIDPHHVANRRWRNVNRDDFTCIPLCRRCHDRWGNLGLLRWLETYGMEPIDLFLFGVDLLVAYHQRAETEVAL